MTDTRVLCAVLVAREPFEDRTRDSLDLAGRTVDADDMLAK